MGSFARFLPQVVDRWPLWRAPTRAIDWAARLPPPFAPSPMVRKIIRVHGVVRETVQALQVAKELALSPHPPTRTEVMGKIKLEGIEVMVRIGLLEEEQFAPQDLYVSLELSYDFSRFGKAMKLRMESITGQSLRAYANSPVPTTEKPWSDFADLLAVELKENSPCPKFAFRSTNRAREKLGIA